MIQLQSKVNIADNTGAIKGRCIKVLTKKRIAQVGDLILVSIIENIPYSKVRKGEKYKAIVIRSSWLNHSDNAVVLVKIAPKGRREKIPIGSRIKGPISKELLNNPKIVSLNPYLI